WEPHAPPTGSSCVKKNRDIEGLSLRSREESVQGRAHRLLNVVWHLRDRARTAGRERLLQELAGWPTVGALVHVRLQALAGLRVDVALQVAGEQRHDVRALLARAFGSTERCGDGV